MKKLIVTSLLYTMITAVILGIGYPLVVTTIARTFFPNQASGQLIHNAAGELIGSRIIGQPFTGLSYFHSRPSMAGTGYDAGSSSGSNFGSTNKALIDRVAQGVKSEGDGAPVPIDLVTASGSGLDPDISPASAFYQEARVARERGISPDVLRQLIGQQIIPRQFGVLGEPRVDVLTLNLKLNEITGHKVEIRCGAEATYLRSKAWSWLVR